MANLYVIVVMYNENCDESVSCRALLNIETPLNIIVVDNSTKSNRNNKFCKVKKWKYINMNGNKGLSKAYNSAINSIEEKDFWIVLIDQDTNINSYYFQCLKESIYSNPDEWVKVPIVKDKKNYLSPSLINNFSVKRIENIERLNNNENITAINSGMAVYSKVFDKMNYDERYFLDYIDHNFIREYKAKFNKKIGIINSILEQNFSDDKHDNMPADITRFKIYIKDFKLFCDGDLNGKIYYTLKVIFRGLKLSKHYRNPVFLSLALRQKDKESQGV